MDPFSRPYDDPSSSEALRRWVNIWNVLLVAIALFATAFALVDKKNSSTDTALIIGFLGLYLVWFWVFIVHLPRWGRRSPVLALSFAMIMLGLAGMTTINNIYYMQFFSMYGIIFSILITRWAVPLTVLLSALGAGIIIINNHMRLSESSGVIIGFGISTFFTLLMGLFITAIIRQSAERQQIIDELKATRENLVQAERQAGILEERQRMSREIHDTLAQGFISIVMHLEAAENALPEDWALEATRQHLDQARNTARDSLAEARRFVWGLHSDPLVQADMLEYGNPPDSQPLAQSIRRIAWRWAEETGTATRVEISGSERSLPPPYEVTLLRTTQEALANVRKHAAARQVTITLTYMDDQVILDIQDDGQGFTPQEVEATANARDGSGFGLIGMRERAEQLGGTLIIESEPGEGTTLMIELPLDYTARHPSEAV